MNMQLLCVTAFIMMALGSTEYFYINNLACKLQIPSTTAKNAVIISHGLFSHKEDLFIPDICDALGSFDIACLSFDSSGCGNSSGNATYSTMPSDIKELNSVYLELEQRNFNVMAFIGHSKGACNVVLYGSRFQSPPVVITIAGRGDFINEKQRFSDEQMLLLETQGYFDWTTARGTIRVTKDDLKRRKKIDISSAIQKSRNTKFLFVHGTRDHTVPFNDVYIHFNACEDDMDCSLKVVEGANHGFTNHKMELIEGICDFIKSFL
ncbi:hypothetical protein P9112_008176 [Eukaryota sp. TZLM1-RC]